jgi:thiol:disulfide interchange protein DsbD
MTARPLLARDAPVPGAPLLVVPLLVVIYALGSASAAARAESGPEFRSPEGGVRLVSAWASAPAGGDARLGLAFDLAPGWHVYWKNPGESGQPPSVEWTLPKGFEAAPMKWPAPRRIEAFGLVSYGYEGDVLFPVTLKVPADAKAGEVVLAARVQWLVCKEVCLDGDVRVEIRLPVKDDAPAADPARAPQFAAAAALLPAALPADAATIRSAKDGVTLTVDAPDLVGADVKSVDFFPAEQLVLDDTVRPALESAKESRISVRLAPAPRRESLVERLRGVLTVATSSRSYAFDVDARTPAPPGETSPR